MQRENRYVVLKISEINNYLDDTEILQLARICNKLDISRRREGKAALECVVIQSNWNCYEEAWNLIEKESRCA